MYSTYQEKLIKFAELHFWEAEYTKRKAFLEQQLLYDYLNRILDNLRAHECNLPYIDNTTTIVHYTLSSMLFNLACIDESQGNKGLIGQLYNQIISHPNFNIIQGIDIGIMEVLLTLDSYYDLDFIEEVGFDECFSLLILSLKYGYYADDLLSLTDMIGVINKLKNNEALPIAPLAFYDIRDSYSHLFKIFVRNEVGKTFSNTRPNIPEIDQNFIKILDNKHNNFVVKKLDDDPQEAEKYKILTLLRKGLNKHSYQRMNDDHKLELLMSYKKLNEINFRSNTNMLRAQGLYLWDFRHLKTRIKDTESAKTTKTIQDAINYLASIDKAKHTSKYYREALINTNACIQNSLFLPMSGTIKSKKIKNKNSKFELYGMKLTGFEDE